MKDEKDKKEQIEEGISPMYHEGHKLLTRRDFLAQGFLGMSAFAIAPSVLSMLASSSVHAAECSVIKEASNMIPMIIFDMSGGANIPGSNVMVGGPGGQLDFLQDYSSLGLPPDMHPSKPGMIDDELGLVFHSDSGILKGIKSVTSPATRKNVDGLIFNTVSNDDTANNELNPAYWIHKAGLTGRLNQIIGSASTESGGRSKAPLFSLDPSVAPVKVSSPQDALNLVSLGRMQNFFSSERDSKMDRILKSIANLSRRKLESISPRSLPEEVKSLLNCGFEQTSAQIKAYTADSLDPRLDPQVTAIFPNINGNTDQRKTATITKLVLDRISAVGVIEKGGYDYHDGSRATGEDRDFQAGQIIGRILELAAAKRSDIVVYVLTDGGVSTNYVTDDSEGGRGKYRWTGDSGQRSSSFMMVYKTNGKAYLKNQNRQVGHFKSNGSIETSALITSNSVINLTKCVVGNYMALHGLDERLANVVDDVPFGKPGSQDWLKYIRFGKS